MLLTNSQHPDYFFVEAIMRVVNIEFFHWASNHSKFADGVFNSRIDDKDGHIPSPLIIVTCAQSLLAPLEWQTNTGVHLKASK